MNRVHWGTEGVCHKARAIRLARPGISRDALCDLLARHFTIPLSQQEREDLYAVFYARA